MITRVPDNVQEHIEAELRKRFDGQERVTPVDIREALGEIVAKAMAGHDRIGVERDPNDPTRVIVTRLPAQLGET